MAIKAYNLACKETEKKVLAVLDEETWQSVGEIAEKADVSLRTARVFLEKLVDHNCVKAQRLWPMFRYKL